MGQCGPSPDVFRAYIYWHIPLHPSAQLVLYSVCSGHLVVWVLPFLDQCASYVELALGNERGTASCGTCLYIHACYSSSPAGLAS